VEWCPTLDSLGIAKRLVDEFEARLRAKCEVKNRRVRPGLKRDERAVVEADVSGRHQKRPQGRPANLSLDVNGYKDGIEGSSSSLSTVGCILSL
jgi:hypothetical protein